MKRQLLIVLIIALVAIGFGFAASKQHRDVPTLYEVNVSVADILIALEAAGLEK